MACYTRGAARPRNISAADPCVPLPAAATVRATYDPGPACPAATVIVPTIDGWMVQ